MLNYFSNCSYYVQLAVWVGFALIANYGLMLLSSRISLEVRRKHHEAAGFLFAVVGVFSALVISSMLVIAVDHFNTARHAIEKEASLVGNVIRIARATSPALSVTVSELMQNELKALSKLEWDSENRDKNLALETDSINKLSLVVAEFEPKTNRETNYHAALVSHISELYQARRTRAISAEESIPPQVWVATIAISFLTIFFSFLFGHEKGMFYYLMSAVLSVSIAIVLSLIYSFDTPFGGDIAVSNKSYIFILNNMEGYQSWAEELKKQRLLAHRLQRN